MLSELVLFIAFAGLLACTIFLALLAVGVVRCRPAGRRHSTDDRAGLPPVSLLKPLHGWEPNLERNLESFFQQDYPSFELIFAARRATDEGLQLVHRLVERYPDVAVKVVVAGEPERPNAKVCALEKMAAACTSEYLVISDSDVHVTPDYVRQVVQPLLDPSVGMVTCMYRGVATGGIWSRLEALGMSVEMTSGVIVADLLEGMRFALGPTMAIRRQVLDSIGGFEALADYCADDFVLGQRVASAGWRVLLSDYVVDHVVLNQTMSESLLHQVRWMKSTRFSRPRGHVGAGLTFAVPFGILAALASASLGLPVLGATLLAYALLNRMAEALIAGWVVVRDPLTLRYFWLYPLRDLLGFFLWCASFVGTSIRWRGEIYRLEFGGRMVRTGASVSRPGDAASPITEPVGIPEL